MDPLPIRLGFILLSLWSGVGVLIYLIMVLGVPEHHIGLAVLRIRRWSVSGYAIRGDLSPDAWSLRPDLV